MTLVLPFVLALVVSATLVPIGRTIAIRLGYIVPRPDGPTVLRSKARFGGVAIAVAWFACAVGTGAFAAAPVLILCSAALFLVGVVSDVIVLKPSTKLVAQIGIASIFLFFNYRLYWADSIIVDSIVTVFWIVGITSAFNLLDSMDGLCGGIALIAGTAFILTVLPVAAGSPLFLKTQYLAILFGAIAGFLIYNLHPASVAMGDAGSLLIGLNMAAMTLQFAAGRGSGLLTIVAVPVLVLMIPIVDGMLGAVSRVWPDPLVASGHDHSSHRLVAIGLSERSAVGLLWLLAAISGSIGVLADQGHQGLTNVVAATFTIAVALFAVYLARVQVHEDVDPNRLTGAITPLGIELGYRRRLAEVLLDLLLVSVAYYGAYRLRYEGLYQSNASHFLQSFPIVLGTQMVALFIVGAYRGMWRYFSLHDGVMFAKGVLLALAAAQLAVLYLYQFDGYSPSVFIIYGMLLLLLLVGSRASFRLVSEFAQRQRHSGRRLVIYGAGDAGAIAVRHLLNESHSVYRIVGFVDDDVTKRNVRVHGYRVIGGFDHLAGMIMSGDVDAVAVTHDGEGAPGLSWLCSKYGVTLHRLAIDWREIPPAEAVATGVALFSGAEARVVPFADGVRARVQGSPVARLGSFDGGTNVVTASFQRDRFDVVDSEAAASPIANVPASISGGQPIRVVHIITRLILGGAQENTLYTAIGQHQDSRFDVTLVCGIDEAGEGNMFEEANRAGVRTVVIPSLLREIRPLTDLKAVFDLYRFLKQGAYTIVHTHSSKAGIIGRVAAKLAGVPIVVHSLHGLVFHEFQATWKNRLFIALKRVCAPMSQKLISVSDRLSETALAHRIGRRGQYVTIYSGIDLDRFLTVGEHLSVAEAKHLAGIPSDAPVVGKIARLFPLKGHDQFLAAAADIHRQMPDVYFLLVGDGPLREQLKAEADRLGFGERVVMVGRVPPERVPEYIQAMDVVVHTSLREGIARVLPQAGAVSKPVVTFDLDGAPEVVRDGVSGYLVPVLDVKAVASRTIELLRDPNLRREFGTAGRVFAADHFSVERMVEQINEVYFDLLAQRTTVGTPCTSGTP